MELSLAGSPALPLACRGKRLLGWVALPLDAISVTLTPATPPTGTGGLAGARCPPTLLVSPRRAWHSLPRAVHTTQTLVPSPRHDDLRLKPLNLRPGRRACPARTRGRPPPRLHAAVRARWPGIAQARVLRVLQPARPGDHCGVPSSCSLPSPSRWGQRPLGALSAANGRAGCPCCRHDGRGDRLDAPADGSDRT